MGEAEIYASITSTVNTHVNKLIKNNTYFILKLILLCRRLKFSLTL